MQGKQFDNMMLGQLSSAALLDEAIKKQISSPAISQQEKKSLLLKFVQENEQPIDTTLHNRIQRRIRKLRGRKWTEIKIRNHIKKHFKITVVE